MLILLTGLLSSPLPCARLLRQRGLYLYPQEALPILRNAPLYRPTDSLRALRPRRLLAALLFPLAAPLHPSRFDQRRLPRPPRSRTRRLAASHLGPDAAVPAALLALQPRSRAAVCAPAADRAP